MGGRSRVIQSPAWTEGQIADRVLAHAAQLGFGELVGDLRLETSSSTALSVPGARIVTVYARYRGVPLARPLAHVFVDASSTVTAVVGGRAWPAYRPRALRLPASAALAKLRASGRPGSVGAHEAELVLADHEGSSRLAWRINPPLDRRAVTNPIFLVDAHSGEIWIEEEQVKTADVSAFEHNPVVNTTPETFTLLELDIDATELRGPWFVAQSRTENGYEHAAIADNGGNFFYPAPDVTIPEDNLQPDDPFAEVQMYFHADRFHAWLIGHGFPGLECHTDGLVATLIANERELGATPDDWLPYNNAYFSGDCEATMVFGQGDEIDFAYDGDVVAHEYGHGVVGQQTTDGLGSVRLRDDGRLTDAGGLNEAISDFLSAVFHGDAQMGEYVAAYWSVLPSDELRNLDNDYRCPHDMVGEVHLDAVPVGGMLWDIYELVGETIVPVVLDTLTMVPRDASMEEFAAALQAVADSALTAAQAQQVAEIISTRGMDDCLRVAPLEPGRRPLFVRQTGQGYSPFAPPPLQFEFTTPAEVDTLRLSFVASHGVSSVVIAEGDVEPGVVVKRGSRIEFVYTGDNPVEVDMGTEEFYTQLENSVDIPASEGESLYLAFVNTGSDRLRLDDITAEWLFLDNGGDGDADTGGDGDGDGDGTGSSGAESSGGSGEDTGEAGTAGDESGGDEGRDNPDADGDSGCACSAKGPSGPGVDLLWVLGALSLRRRRRQ